MSADYAIIISTCGKVIKLDWDDYQWAKELTWYVRKDGYAANSEYVGGGRKNAKYRTNRMHRMIMKAEKGEVVDHINRDRLDNRKCNLRLVSQKDNALNRGPNKNNTSGYKGVYWRDDVQKWLALITYQKTTYCLGFFTDKNDAARAYNEKAIEFFGENAYLNDIKEVGEYIDREQNESGFTGAHSTERGVH